MNNFVYESCFDCKHFLGVLPQEQDGPNEVFAIGRCKAFPDGIPPIVQNGIDWHRSPIDGDHDIQYEQGKNVLDKYKEKE